MNKTYILLILVMLSSNVYGQSDSLISLKDLASPTSPAFTIINLSPTDVSRPSSSKSLIMSFANSLNSTNGVMSDIAIEFSPYWFSKHENLTFEEYYNKNITAETKIGELSKKLCNNVIQSTSFSFATSDFDDGIDSTDARNVSGGIKFQIITGKPSEGYFKEYRKMKNNDSYDAIMEFVQGDSCKNLEDLKKSIISRINSRIDTKQELKTNDEKEMERSILIPFFLAEIAKSGLTDSSSQSDIKNFIESKINEYEKSGEKIIVDFTKDAISSRVGLIWEVAFASSILLPTNEIDYSIGNKWGIWSTLTYRSTNAKNDFNLMLRRLGSYEDVKSYNTDIGLSYIINRSKYNVSLEGILRNYHSQFEIESTTGGFYMIDKDDYTSRFSVSLQYSLTDYINLTATIGKNYNDKISNFGDIYSLVNFNIVLPDKQLLKVK